MPTETVYGLAGDAANAVAIARIYEAKGRPAFNPLIAHVHDTQAALKEGVFDERALALAGAFWPGPLTLIVPAAPQGQVCELARAGLTTVGLRVPGHPVARSLLKRFDGPLAAPSANRSGRLSPTMAEHVRGEFAEQPVLILDGGACVAGVESTIVAVLPDQPVRLLRPGAIPRAELEAIAGPLSEGKTPGLVAPGQQTSHYAPRAELRLNAVDARAGEVLLAFGSEAPPHAMNLSGSGDLVEAAANLYRMLRALDASGAAVIAVMPIPEEGLGEAINDRLRRAAAPRPVTER